MVSFCVLDERTFQDTNRAFQLELVRATGYISPSITLEIVRQFNTRPLEPLINFKILQAWLDFRNVYHTETCIISNLRPMRSFRVIDCDNRTIIPAGTDCQYIALSYVWGISTEENWNEKWDVLPVKLPRTIEDAIVATRSLGYQYLWVDRYCIPQQDDDERCAQVYQMDLIYNNAQATIIAVAGNEPTFGLPGVQNRLRAPQAYATIGDTKYVYVLPDPAHEIQNSKWNSRS